MVVIKENYIGIETRILSNTIKKSFDCQLERKFGDLITGIQSRIVGYIANNCESAPVFQRDLEQKFNVSPATMTATLHSMEKNELIIRNPVDYDARLKKLTLTPKALELNKQIVNEIDNHEQMLRKNISDKELALFFETIEKIKSNIK